MKIEVFSDYVCPFCYIGERRLVEALKIANINNADIEFKSFELDPNAKKSYSESLDELIANKYGVSKKQASDNNQRLIQAAKEMGLVYNFDTIKHTNTFDAHRLSYLFKEKGLLNEYTELVMHAYFTDSLLISDFEVLSNLVSKLPVSKEEVMGVLNSDLYSNDVRESERDAHSRGVKGVPYFVIDGKETIYGAQPVEVFTEILLACK